MSRAALALFAAVVTAGGCARPVPVSGEWRATLGSPGGELPFRLVLAEEPGGKLTAAVWNAYEEIPVTTARRDGEKIFLRFDHYDSEIEATLGSDGRRLAGLWTRQAGRDRPAMTFTAVKGEAGRFGPFVGMTGTASVLDPGGVWEAVFTDPKESFVARAEFKQGAAGQVTGTFLTPTGDYRVLEGDYQDGLLRLSCFDGAHAFLFVARAAEDGTLVGDFWSRTSYHAAWVARRKEVPALPDAFALTTLTSPTGRLRFSFPDLDGRTVTSDDPTFAGKVLLVDIFGSWCPNCNDQAPVLADLYRRYHDRGLEVVGVAYEMTGEPGRDGEYVRKFAARHGVRWPLLLAGTSDKTEASRTLPDLSGVLAFPTLVLIGRDGRVAAIHTGFAGPGTGQHFEDLKARYVEILERLLQPGQAP